MVKWTRVCRSKRIGGLGIKDLHKQNISLLTKWWWKLETKDGLWQQIIRARYFKNKTVANIRSRFSDSPCWKAIMKVKETYMAGRAVKVNSGNLARVWHEPWIDAVPLCEKFPVLFSICQDQDETIADFVAKNYSLGFMRRLFGGINDQWEWVVSEAKKYTLDNIPDTVFWKLCKNKRLTTK